VRLFWAAGIRPVETRYVIVLPTARSFATALEKALRAVPLGAQYLVAGRRLS
jgi:hypothetical protein